MTLPEWFRVLLQEAAASNRSHIIARMGPVGLKWFYDDGLKPSIHAILEHKGHTATPTERWQERCEQVQVEKDPSKMLQLTDELARLLEAKERQQREERKASKSVQQRPGRRDPFGR